MTLFRYIAKFIICDSLRRNSGNFYKKSFFGLILAFFYTFGAVAMNSSILTESSLRPLKSQNVNQRESQSFTYENVRVTVTKRGVVGGDLNTGKVIWRSGFDPNPENYVIVKDTKFFGAYLFYLISGRVSGGTFLETKTGKQITFVKDFYLKEGNFYYFNDITFTNIVDRTFADIAIFEFDSKTKKMKEVTFIVDQYLNPETRVYCVSSGPEYFNFVSKAKNTWKFKYSGRKCEIEVEFDYTNLQKFSFNVKKKG